MELCGSLCNCEMWIKTLYSLISTVDCYHKTTSDAGLLSFLESF